MQQQQRILIAPLDWGLGHATRCIPIIRYLLEKQQQVIVAADGRPLALLRKEFPDIEHIQLKGYSIKTYPESKSFIEELIEGYQDNVKIKAIQQEIGMSQWQLFKQIKSLQQMMAEPQARLPIFVVNPQ